MLTLTEMIASAFDLPPVDIEPSMCDSICVLSGQSITSGYPVMDIASHAMGEFWETFNGNPHGYLSESAARCWKSCNPHGVNICRLSMAVFDGVGYLPLVNRDAAEEQGRPCWSDLVRDAWKLYQKKPCGIVLTTDTKKRIFQSGRSGILGEHTPVLVCDPQQFIYQVLDIDWPVMLCDLDFCEIVYNVGFSKRAVAESLFREMNQCLEIGMEQARDWERKLRVVRNRAHFPIINIIMQRRKGI